MTDRLAGKIALVTGGTSGIGLAAATRFAAEGAQVVIAGRRREALDEAVAAIGGETLAVQADVAQLPDLERLRDVIVRRFGRLDALFANAGAGQFASIEALDEAHYDEVVGVNFKGVIFTVRSLVDLMPDGSAIALTTSVANVKGIARLGTYAAAKAAVRSLARSWTSDLSHRRIRVNAISPGYIDTPSHERVEQDDPAAVAAHERIMAQIPLGRAGGPDEVAAAAAFLLSDEASYITGIELAVDGGLTQV